MGYVKDRRQRKKAAVYLGKLLAVIKMSVSEALAQGYCRVSSTHSWVEARTRDSSSALKAFEAGSCLTVRCPPELTGFRFLRHAWSGTLEIAWLGQSMMVDLSAEEEDMDYVVDLPGDRSSEFDVSICISPEARRPADRSEAWLLGFVFSALPKPMARSLLLNERVRLIHGDWGDYLVLSTDVVIPNAVIAEGAWAPHDIKVFEGHVQPGDFVLDVGANFGHHSVVFSKLVGDNGLVIAVEAQRTMFQLVNANSVLNGCLNLVPLHLAAGAQRGEVTLYPISYDSEENFGALGVNTEDAALWKDTGGEQVELWPLDEIVDRYAADRRLSFIKIDVQAYELFVLQGLEKTILQHRPTIFTEISPVWMRKAGYDYREIYHLLSRLGYTFTHRAELTMSSDGIPDVSDEVDIEWDLLAVHPERQ